MDGLRTTGEQLIETVAYGDAAGLPVETKRAEQIRQQYGWLGRLVSTDGNPYFKGYHETGTWSDDTQLSIAVTEGLIEAEGFELQTQAEAHVRAYHRTPKVLWEGERMPVGWGGSTTRSIRRIMQGIPPEMSGEPEGSGNGILMKLGPLAYWHYVCGTEQNERYTDYDALTRMTHDSEVAVACTRLHGDMLTYLLDEGRNGFIPPSQLTAYLMERAARHEVSILDGNNQLTGLLAYLERFERIDASYILAHTDGKGFYVPQTLAMAYGAYLMNDGFPDCVWGAVNLGGDTDSIASIVGVMSLFAHGRVNFPGEAELLQDRDRLRQISHSLTYMALLQR